MSKLTFSALPPELKRISNDSLGSGVLKSLFNYSYTYHLMVKLSEGEFVGFALYHLRKDRVDNKTQVVGVLDCVCISEEHRGFGFGSLLTFGAMRKMSSSGAASIEYSIKAPPIKRNAQGEIGGICKNRNEFLSSLGFREKAIYDNYYVKSSVKYGYKCNFCGKKPDSCSAFIFMLNSIDE